MTASEVAGPVRAERTLVSYFRIYGTLIRTAIIEQFQYRAANYFYMIGMVTEPIVYLVVWSTIAAEQGGNLDGYTPARFAAYYIVWTLVRNMNIVLTPWAWEERIREGTLSAWLARPLHPIHYDLGFFAGWKVVVIVLWIPIAIVLSVLFDPALHPRPSQIAVFAVAIWGAYLIRTFLLWILGMVTFWTTRVSALFEAFFALELLLSGRLVPIELMPEWAQTLANFFPFQWTFGFPITALVGPITDEQLLWGLAAQLGWILGLGVATQLAWRRAIKVYTAVAG